MRFFWITRKVVAVQELNEKEHSLTVSELLLPFWQHCFAQMFGIGYGVFHSNHFDGVCEHKGVNKFY